MRNFIVISLLVCMYIMPIVAPNFYLLSCILLLALSFIYNKIDDEEGTLVCALIISLPLAFYPIDMLGLEFNTSIFYFISLLIVANSFFIKFYDVSNLEIAISLAIIAIGLVLVINLPTPQSCLQFVNFILFLNLIFFIRQHKSQKYFNLYVNASIAFSIILIFQYLQFWLGTPFGKFSVMGERISFGYFGWDYSHLSIYLAVSFYLLACEKKYAALIVFAALIVCNARSGMAALCLFAILKIFRRQAIYSRLILLSMLAIFVLNLIILRPEGLSSVGRLESYYVSVNSFLEHNMLGYGFDGLSYIDQYQMVVPHSFLIQIFTQFGLPFGLMMLIFLILEFKKSFRKDVILILFAGFLFVPDLQASKFAPILIGILTVDDFYQTES